MQVRPATAADTHAMGALHRRAWQVAYRDLFPSEALEGLVLADFVARWRERLEAPGPRRSLVAVDAGEVVGLGAWGPSRDADAGPATAEVYAVYVDPDAWGRGAGRALLEACRREAREAGFRRLTLWVLEANAGARAFYERLGLAPDGARKAYERWGLARPELRYGCALAEPPCG